MPNKQLEYLKDLTYKLETKDKELRQRDELLQLVMEEVTSCAWIWTLEDNTIIDSCGCRMEKVFGKEVDTFETFIEVCHPEDADRLKISLDAALTTGQKFDECHRIVMPNGEIKALHTIAILVENKKMVGFSVELNQSSKLSCYCKSGAFNG